WRCLAGSHNFNIDPGSKESYTAEFLHQASVLHYHSFLSESNFPRFVELLEPAYPEIASYLSETGPIRGGRSLSQQFLARPLAWMRGFQRRLHLRNCVLI